MTLDLQRGVFTNISPLSQTYSSNHWHTWITIDFLFRQQFSSVAQLCPTLCDPMDGSTAGLLVHHQLLQFTQTHVCWVGDAIQPSHSLSSTFNLSQHQGLFQWVSSLHHVAKVMKLQLQHPFFQWIFRTISFRIDWFDLLAVQGTLKSLLQHHSSKV